LAKKVKSWRLGAFFCIFLHVEETTTVIMQLQLKENEKYKKAFAGVCRRLQALVFLEGQRFF